MPLRIVMMGTGTFALPTFQALIASEHDVVGLVTQPDRTGRGHHNHVNELKETAIAAGIPVFQPDRANAAESLDTLRSFNADLFVVAAYGQILSANLLAIPRLGAINLHASLLPKYRGAAPVQYSIWKGESETGVTIFQIEPKLDAGPILGVLKTPIGEKETSGQLHDRLAEASVPLALEVVKKLEEDRAEPLLQENSEVTLAPRIRKEQGRINWNRTATEIGWHVRAMQPWPGADTFLVCHGRPSLRVLILEVEAESDEQLQQQLADQAAGSLHVTQLKQLLVRCGEGVLRVERLQPAGKRPMSAEEFTRGRNIEGARFADSE